MARIIKSKKRRRGGAKKAAAKVKYITRTVANKTRAAYKRAAGWKITKKDLVLSVAGAAGGAIAAPVASGFIPASIPDVVKNTALAVAGGAVAYYGLKKKNMTIAGFGMGMGASSGALIVKGFIKPAETVAGPIAAISYPRALPAVAPMNGAFSTMGAAFRPDFVTDDVNEDEV